MKKGKLEKLEEERQALDARRRKGRSELQANLAANRAEALANHSETVYTQAQAVANRYRAELERRQAALDRFVGELDGGERDRATLAELDRLAKRLEVAERKAAMCKVAYEANAAAAKKAAPHRKLWLELP